jgi:hypothetical protein
MAQHTTKTSRTLKRPIVLACVILLLAGIPVQLTGAGIDLFALLTGGVALFVLDRTLGDAVAEYVGPLGTALLFTAFAAIGVGYMLTDTGQSRAKRFLAAAETRGYKPLYFTAERTNPNEAVPPPKPEDGRSGGGAPRARPVVAPSHDMDVERTPAASGASSPSSATPHVVSPGLFSTWGASETPLARLTVSPDIVVGGETVNLQLRIIGTPVTLTGPVVFFVNDREVARVVADANGTASARTSVRVPGTYRAAVRLPAGTRATAARVVSFTVLPSTGR